MARQDSSTSTRRTNSLAFAKIDCHTCTSLNKHCDRQRPRCGTCISNKRKCGGFAMDLVWKDFAASVHNDLASQSTDCNVFDTETAQCQRPSPRGRHEFKFRQGRPRKKRISKSLRRSPEEPSAINDFKTHWIESVDFPLDTISPGSTISEISVSQETASGTGYSSYDPSTNEMSLIYEEPYTVGDGASGPSGPNLSPTDRASSELSIHSLSPEALENFLPDDHGQIRDSYFATFDIAGPERSAMVTYNEAEEDEQYPIEKELPLTEGVLYQDQAHKYHEVLRMYDEEFCVLPLTMDCRTNPFRVRENHCEGSSFLLHAILAYSAQHLAKKRNCNALMDQMHVHRSASIHLFSQALCQSNKLALLDTLLIMFSLEATQSASSMWGVHLDGARKLLVDARPFARNQDGSRKRAQLAMLVWWDVTISFISRKEPRFPITYLDSLMWSDKFESDDWSFLNLNGCPAELVLAMARLAKLAAIYEKTKHMEWTIFNRLPVDAIFEEVKNYTNREDVSFEELKYLDIDPQAKRNRFLCIEAWRHAVLLYTCRVFNTSQDEYGLRMIDYLARVILDNVRCIPDTATIQKQLLLPVFLAGSEVGDEQNRSFIRRYCSHWNYASRFSQFETTIGLLEDIWSDWDSSIRDVYWWGTKAGYGSWPQSSSAGQHMVSELLLG